MNKRLNRKKLIIGTYCLKPYGRTEEHIKDLSECGIDMIVCLDRPDKALLDLLEKYHVGCIVSGILPGWWGGDGTSAGTLNERNPLSLYIDKAKEFEDHPAIWGVDIGDEPSALDFEHYGKIADTVDKCFVNQFPYLNLYPNYASVATNSENQTECQLGTATYQEHIDEYVKRISLPYISYDFYVYSLGRNIGVGKMLDNYRIVADACRRTGRDFWYIPQVNSLDPAVFTSINRLRYQAYTALCYGATVISWACYTKGWWENNVLDDNGSKTEQYEKLKAMNRELKNISDLYMEYRNVSTYLLGFENEPWYGTFPEISCVETLDTGTMRDLHADGGSLVVGQMVKKNDPAKTAYVICNTTDAYDENPAVSKITFRTDKTVKVYSGEGVIPLEKNGNEYAFDLGTCRGVIITLE